MVELLVSSLTTALGEEGASEIQRYWVRNDLPPHEAIAHNRHLSCCHCRNISSCVRHKKKKYVLHSVHSAKNIAVMTSWLRVIIRPLTLHILKQKI